MRIIIEPTEPPIGSVYYTRVELSVPSDEQNFDDTLQLVRAALIAWGFHQSSLDSVFNPEVA